VQRRDLDLQGGVAEAAAQDRVQRRQVGAEGVGGVGGEGGEDAQGAFHGLGGLGWGLVGDWLGIGWGLVGDWLVGDQVRGSVELLRLHFAISC